MTRELPRNQRHKIRKKKLFLPLLIFLLMLIAVIYRNIPEFEFNFVGSDKIVSPLPTTESPEIKFSRALQEHNLITKNLKISGNEALVNISGVDAQFDLKGDIKTQVVSLQVILRQATIEGKLPKKVDLRFSKPVVLY